MTRNALLASATLLTALAISTAAGADPYRPYGWGMGGGYSAAGRIDERQARQDMRINRGMYYGQISPRERAALEADQARIREMERRARMDGRIDPYEAREIARAQDEASRRIAMARHNGEGGWGWRRWYHRWW